MAYSSITKPTDYFNTVLYTGNGSVTTHTGVGFQPDMVWIKERNGTNNHEINDAVRGANYQIYPNLTNAQTNAGGHLTAFASDGFTLGTDGAVNTNTNTYVSWNWKANGTGSSNSDGSVTSTVSANTTAGFSVVVYTGTGSNATVGHGLGAVPKMIFFKDRETAVDWGVYAEPNGNTKEMYLSTTDAAGTNTGAFNSTTPTSSVFTIGTSSRYNPSSKSVVAYCFVEKKGYSKINSYTGNGSTAGPFVYTGFKPAWILSKRTDNSSGGEWCVLDNKRDTFNAADAKLEANNSDAEETDEMYDILSNGFKITRGDGNINASGGTYLYMAFAENPFVGNDSGTAVPVVAR